MRRSFLWVLSDSKSLPDRRYVPLSEADPGTNCRAHGLLLVSLLGLQQARVLKHSRLSFPEVLQKVGELAAKVFAELLRDEVVIGMSWDTAIYETVKALPPNT